MSERLRDVPTGRHPSRSHRNGPQSDWEAGGGVIGRSGGGSCAHKRAVVLRLIDGDGIDMAALCCDCWERGPLEWVPEEFRDGRTGRA